MSPEDNEDQKEMPGGPGTDLVARDNKGRFVKGVSGNPAGKPKGVKHRITELRQNTELALRDYLAHPDNQLKAMEAIDRVMDIVRHSDEKTSVAAAKLILDKLVPNARGGSEDEHSSSRGRPTTMVIVNQTEGARSPVEIIETEYTVEDGDWEDRDD
jgi:hypothetical protein